MILVENHDHEHDHEHDHGNIDLIAEAYKLLKDKKPITTSHGSHSTDAFTSIREMDYKRHHIIIRTRYEVEIDGKVINSQIYVDNEGKVSTHALPAYSFPSTVDMLKSLIDKFPTRFSADIGNGETN